MVGDRLRENPSAAGNDLGAAVYKKLTGEGLPSDKSIVEWSDNIRPFYCEIQRDGPQPLTPTASPRLGPASGRAEDRARRNPVPNFWSGRGGLF